MCTNYFNLPVMKNFFFITSIFLFLGISGCNDDSSESPVIIGTFIDDPVQGLHYKCS